MSLRMIESIKRLRVTPTQKLVLFCLADCHNGDTGRCDPSYAYIMQVTGLSNRAVATALQALRAAGQLRFDSRNGSRSSYQITPHDAAEGAPPSSASSVPPPPAPLPPPGPELPPGAPEKLVPLLIASAAPAGPPPLLYPTIRKV